MSSPSRYRNASPVRTLEERFYSKPLEVILEENNALKLSNSLIYQNKSLEKENQRLVYEIARSKEGETQNYSDNLKLRKEKERLEYDFRSLEAASAARDEAKERQLQSQERDIRLLKNEYERENTALKEQILNLTNKIDLIEASKNQELENLKEKCLSVTTGQTQFIKKNLGEELHKVVGQLQLTKHLLEEKERENQHLVILSQQASSEYTQNLQKMISENNVLRNQLISLELEKNKEIHQAENKKELEKSRTIGILSFCKENSQFMEKELTRLAEQLLQKNISIETFTKELLKQRKHAETSEKKYEQTLSKIKADYQEELREKEKEISKLQKTHQEDLTQYKKRELDLEQKLASKLNDLDNAQREINHIKEQISVKNKEIEELKDNIARMHDDHSKELSKVMLDSRVKRRSGMNISSYSSSSLKDIEDAQGSSIIKAQSLDRKNSSNEILTPSGLPVVKEELAVSQGHIDEEEQDIEIKELILHYESMIEELKKNKADELSLASKKIEGLKLNLQQKQQELIQTLNRFTPLMELKVNRASLEEERRVKIEQSQKADIAILDVLLEKYGIVSLRSKVR